jgi:hypothetical protein
VFPLSFFVSFFEIYFCPQQKKHPPPFLNRRNGNYQLISKPLRLWKMSASEDELSEDEFEESADEAKFSRGGKVNA